MWLPFWVFLHSLTWPNSVVLFPSFDSWILSLPSHLSDITAFHRIFFCIVSQVIYINVKVGHTYNKFLEYHPLGFSPGHLQVSPSDWPSFRVPWVITNPPEKMESSPEASTSVLRHHFCHLLVIVSIRFVFKVTSVCQPLCHSSYIVFILGSLCVTFIFAFIAHLFTHY